MNEQLSKMSKRNFLKLVLGGGMAVAAATIPTEWTKIASAEGLPMTPFEQGKILDYPRLFLGDQPVTQRVDLGTLGPDCDTIFGFDFAGDLKTDATIISRPASGVAVVETRIVGIKRTNLEYVQIEKVLGGDQFIMHKAKEFGIGDAELDAIARLHAKNTAHTHQKVVYIGDLGLFEKEWGAKERALLDRIIWAQRPGNASLGIKESNFSSPRTAS